MKSQPEIYSRYFTYIKPVIKSPIIKNYGPAIFSLLTMSILIFFAIRPTVETILVLQKKLADSNEVLQKATQKAENLSLGKKNYDNLCFNCSSCTSRFNSILSISLFFVIIVSEYKRFIDEVVN